MGRTTRVRTAPVTGSVSADATSSRASGRAATDRGRPRDLALDALFRTHYADLLRLGQCLLSDRGRAEDAVQDAFISLWANWDHLRDVSAALPYLRSAVIYRCRSRMRERLRLVVTADPGSGPGTEPSSEESLLDGERSASLAAAVQSLPRRQREVLVCRYMLELSIAETALLLEIGEGSVKRHAHRGLASLNARMGQLP
jgi:RNA polymerase sigma factor (sigma-70 family)